MAGLVKRGRIWHMRLQVPKRFSSIESRREIVRSLRTSDKAKAEVRLIRASQIITSELNTKLGHDRGGRSRCYASCNCYSAGGLLFQEDLAMEVLDRLGKIHASLKRIPDKLEAAFRQSGAISGGAKTSERTMMQLAREMSVIRRNGIKAKNNQQLRVWERRWSLVARQIEEALGYDPVVDLISDAEAHKFVVWLEGRIARGDLKIQTANTRITQVNSMIVSHRKDTNQRDRTTPFSGRHLSDPYTQRSRKREIPNSWIQEVLLNEPKMSGLNSEAQDILLVCLETGCRQSEISDLPSQSVHLNHDIPYLEIDFQLKGEQRREIKNTHSIRRVPLVGVSLEAMRRHPMGFPRYRGKGNFCSTVHSFFKRRNLMIPGHSLGGLRHNFEGRLIRIGVENDIRAELIGHSVRRARGRERYGDELSLFEKRKFHELISFRRVGE